MKFSLDGIAEPGQPLRPILVRLARRTLWMLCSACCALSLDMPPAFNPRTACEERSQSRAQTYHSREPLEGSRL